MKKDKIFLIVGLVCLIGAAVSGAFLLRYGWQSQKQQEQYRSIAQIYHGESDRTADGEDTKDIHEDTVQAGPGNLSELQSLNPDCVGWICIPDTSLDYPVVFRDNRYYLTHNFMQEASGAGAVFLDENCTPDGDIRLLHGHHMKDGSMFGILKKYKKADFRDAHRELVYQDGETESRYRMIALLLADLTKEDYFHYEDIPQDDKKDYIRGFLKNALWKDADLSEKDYEGKFLLLSTCEYGTKDQRLVILAVCEDTDG